MFEKAGKNIVSYFPIFFVSLIVSVLSEKYMPQMSSRLTKAILDNICHGIISSLVMFGAYTFGCSDKFLFRYSPYFELFLAFIASCVLDIDHFIAASSLSLYTATHLGFRPYGHALIVPTILSGVRKFFLISVIP